MNDELEKRIEWINAEESERNIAFLSWIDGMDFDRDRARCINELGDYVAGLLAEIGDLQETIARLELNDE